MSGRMIGAVYALGVAAGSVGLVLLHYWCGFAWAAAAVIVVAGLGWLAEKWAASALPREPEKANARMMVWALLPAAVAAGAAFLVFLANVQLAGLKIAGVPDETAKEIGKALATAIAAFFGAVAIKAASDADTEWIGPRVKALFAKHYRRAGKGEPTRVEGRVAYYAYDSEKPEATSPIEAAIKSGFIGDETGWGADARMARAAVIKDAMANIP